jgi:hypothetical protein
VIIIVLVFTNLSIISKLDAGLLEGKRFTYEDGVVLYNICQKNGGSKEALVNRIYEGKNTDFREFIL